VAVIFAVEATDLTKCFGTIRALDGVTLNVPSGSIFGLLGANGAGKTTLLRVLLGIIDPDQGGRRLLGEAQPLHVAGSVGYLPEERGLYPGMTARETIAFMGALHGLPLRAGRARADALLAEHSLDHLRKRPIRSLSKGQAQLIQLLATIVHDPQLLVLDEPFAGLDALNQERLEAMIRSRARAGATILFSTHVIAHAERLCENIAIMSGGRVHFAGSVIEARNRMRSQVQLVTRHHDGPWRSALPKDAYLQDGIWRFDLPETGIESLLADVIGGGAGITNLSIERPTLHDAFIAIVGEPALERSK